MPTFYNIFQEIAYKRLVLKRDEIREKFPWVLALKLSGSIGDGYVFLFMFKHVTIASDYDILAIAKGFPDKDDFDEFIKLLKKPEFPSNPIESILLENIDIKVYTTDFAYTGEGKRLPSILNRDLTVIRHLQNGLIVFGKEYFDKYGKLTEKDKRRIYNRVRDRERIFNLYTDLGALLREARALDNEYLEKQILDILRRYGNYHVLAYDDLQELEKIKKSLEKEISNE